MKARLVLAVRGVALGLALAGCGKGGPAAVNDEAPRPPAKAAAADSADSAPAPSVGPGDRPKAPSPPTTADAEPGEVEPPSKAEARSAAAAVLGSKLAVLTPTVPVGSARFAAAWRVRDEDAPTAATAHLVVYERADGEWTALHYGELLAMDTPWLEGDEPPPIPTTIKSDDYDDDGSAEILVRIGEQIMCPGAGPNSITHLMLFNDGQGLQRGEGLQRAHSSELHHRNDNGIATTGKAEHVDLDSDGHRDLRITYVTKDEHDGSSKTQTNTWRHDPKTDTYVADQVEYEASGCDW